ncbi:Plasma membrane fusion protein prm1 [Golovinomyces cichoracearum]|uniref:Plasma membrane fusion protein PRM1 n=1 Tax=Golovinomyces cichoracearum TaxID=62708 RepID=A0A420HZ78_9PEZI|nr:Plasma membrane fusion protein prm1 [Golovinomyces cichoracearum]
MSFSKNQFDDGFPSIPSSLNAGDYQMKNLNIMPQRLSSNRPYLGLQARLSQIWINRGSVLLLLILCRLLLATRDLNYNVGRAKEEALEACSSVENVGSAMASMPHYLSTGVNTLTIESITKTVDEMMEMMMDSLDLVSNIVLFVINMFTQTYACLITFAVTGSLAASIELIEKVGKFMNESIGPATETLARDSQKFQDGLNDFLKKIQLPAFLGGTKAVPKIDISGPIESLRNIKIDPTAMNSELNRLNSSLPNFADVQKFTEQAINFPFMQLRKMINDSKVSYSFDQNVFPVAEKKKLTFCSDNNIINNFFNDILAIISKAKSLFTALLMTLAVLFAVATAFKEIRAWKKLHDRAIFMANNIEDHLELMDLFSRPLTSIAGYQFAVKIFHSIKRQNLVRWLIAYGTTVPALYVLSLGFAGLFSCLCQYILLMNVQKEVPMIAEEVGNFSDIVVKSLDDASKQWAIDANNVISGINTKINKDVFGWVQTGTGAVNETIDKFTDEMTRALNVTFGGTVLYKPIVEVMNCLVGLKVASFQRGLTWVHDQAHISIPEFKPNVFSLGAAASMATSNSSDSFLASTGDIASDKVTTAIMKVVVKLQESIKEEAIIATVLISLWIILVFIGLSRVIIADLKPNKVHGEGGLPSYTPDTIIISHPPENIPLSKFRRAYFKIFRQSTLSSPHSRNSTPFGQSGSRKPFENEKTSQIS